LNFGAGFALLCFPSITVELLLGAPLETLAALTVARVGGAGLLALGVACWLARGDTQSRAARGLVAAMLLYDVGRRRCPRFRRHRLWTAGRGVVAGSGSPRGDDRLVCHVPAAQSVDVTMDGNLRKQSNTERGVSARNGK
jgi:hypothetical protein